MRWRAEESRSPSTRRPREQVAPSAKTLRTKDAFTGFLSNRVRGGRGWVDHGGRGDARRPRGAKALGPEALARAMRHRRWRAVHARRSRPAVSDRREPGSAEKKREPKRVHRLIVPATRRVTGASGAPFSDSLLMHPDSPPAVARRRAGKTRRATPPVEPFSPREF